MYCITVTWEEPSPGIAVYGPYEEQLQAHDNIPAIQVYFMNTGTVPEDVVVKVIPMTEPENPKAAYQELLHQRTSALEEGLLSKGDQLLLQQRLKVLREQAGIELM